jgi:hypothetical protein
MGSEMDALVEQARATVLSESEEVDSNPPSRRPTHEVIDANGL